VDSIVGTEKISSRISSLTSYVLKDLFDEQRMTWMRALLYFIGDVDVVARRSGVRGLLG